MGSPIATAAARWNVLVGDGICSATEVGDVVGDLAGKNLVGLETKNYSWINKDLIKQLNCLTHPHSQRYRTPNAADTGINYQHE